MIIGLSGYAQVGKDTIGKALVEGYGFTRFAFADALKECVYRLNPIVVAENAPDYVPRGPYLVTHRVQDYVDSLGWEEAKKYPEVRRLLQVMGTEAGRQVLGDNIWVDAVLNKVGSRDVVITDCRFPNEAQAVKERGGHVVRVVRPGVDAVNAHPSETSLDDWPFDRIVINGGSMDDVETLASDLYDDLKSSRYDLQLF
jgi:hypothetical protein